MLAKILSIQDCIIIYANRLDSAVRYWSARSLAWGVRFGKESGELLFGRLKDILLKYPCKFNNAKKTHTHTHLHREKHTPK